MQYKAPVSVWEYVTGIDLQEKWLALSHNIQKTDINEDLSPKIKSWCLLQLSSGLVSGS